MRKNTYLRFGGIDITNYGAVFSGSDEFRKPEKMMDYYSVPGRNGDIAVSQEKYSNIVLPFSCYIHEDFQENFHKLVNDLAALEGYQKLESSEEPDHYRLALFSTAIEPDMGALNERGAFILEFNCKPQRFLKVGDVAINVTSNRTVDEGTVVSADDTDYTTRIESAEVQLDPYLNTNGFDNVWLAGYGKNKLKTTATEETVNGLTFSPNDDGTIDVSGTSSEALTVSADSEIYSKRVVENGYRLFDEVVGGSIIWNQLVDERELRASGMVTTFADGVFTYSGTTNGTNVVVASVGQVGNLIQTNHVYCITSSKSDSSITLDCRAYNGSTYEGNFSANTIYRVQLENVRYMQFRIRGLTVGTAYNGTFKAQVFDLTAMFGESIADYIYQLEQSNSGSGVAFFKKLFPLDYYAYNVGTIMSVCTSQHKMSNGNGFNAYTLSPLTLRGIPKLVDNKLVYDGDVYKSSGSVQRRYAEVDLGTLTWIYLASNKLFSTTISGKKPSITEGIVSQYVNGGWWSGWADKDCVWCGNAANNGFVVKDTRFSDAATFKTAMNGVKLVYELATPTTESTTPFTNPQVCEQGGTEEYIDHEVSQGNRDVSIPVGHNTFYADYVVSTEAKLTEGETYNVSDNLTVGYRDSSGMHTTTNSLTIPSGGEYEFTAYTIAANQTPAKMEPMIYDGIPTIFEPYENAGYLVTYDKAVMTETPRNVYLMDDETKYTHGVYVKCKDGVVTLDGNNTDATYKEIPVGERFETAGGYIASGGIPQRNCYLFVKRTWTPLGGTIQTEDIMVYDQDVAVTLSANENASAQFYIHIAPSEGNGLEFKPMLRHTPITDDEFTEGVTGSREFSQTFNSPIAAGAYDFYSNNLTETWALLDLSTVTWTAYAASSTRRCYRATINQYPRGAFTNTPDFLAELYTIQQRTNDPRINNDLDSHEVGIYGQYTTATASTLLYIIMPLDAGTPEGYFAYKLYEPVVTNYGPTGNVDVIPNTTTYFFSYSRELFRGPHYNNIKLTYNSPTVIENPTNMASLPLISIVNNDSVANQYVYVNNAGIHLEINGDVVIFYDAEMRDAYQELGDIYASMNQYVAANRVITLKPGKNTVARSSDNMVVKIIPRWWEL